MNYNPTVDYRSDRTENAHPSDAGNQPRSRITELATRGALAVAVAVWAVVGFLIWVPLLLRRIVTFVAELTYVALTDGDPRPAAERLRSAASFYRRGFVTAVESVLDSDDGARDGPVRSEVSHDSSAARPILQELAWSLVVWYPVLLWMGIAELTPSDLWNAATAVPWQEAGSDLVRGTPGWIEQVGLETMGWIEEFAGRLGL